MAPSVVDLTMFGSDDELRIVSSTQRQPGTKASQAREARSSSAVRDGFRPSRKHPSNGLTPTANLNDASIDLRSSPHNGSVGSKDKSATSTPSFRSTGMSRASVLKAIRKSAHGVPPSGTRRESPTVLDDSTEEELPDIQFKPKTAANKETQLSISKERESSRAASSPLKRRLDPRDDKGTNGQPSKKARLDDRRDAGRSSSTQVLGNMSKCSAHSVGTKTTLVPYRLSSDLSQSDTPLRPAAGSKSALASIGQNGDLRKSSSPLGNHLHGSAFPRRRKHAVDTRTSEDRSTLPRQASDPVRKVGGSDPKDGTSKNSAAPRSKPDNARIMPELSSALSPCSDGSKMSFLNATQAAKTARVSPRPDSSPRRSTNVNSQASPEPSIALQLLNSRASSQERRYAKGRHTGSSDDDQGYVSHGLNSAKYQREKCGPGTPSLISSPQNETAMPSQTPGNSDYRGQCNVLTTCATEKASVDAAVALEGSVTKSQDDDDARASVTRSIETTEEVLPTCAKTGGSANTTQVLADFEQASEDAEQALAISGVGGVLQPQDRARAPDTPRSALNSSDNVIPNERPQNENDATTFEVISEAEAANDQLQSEALRAQTDSLFAVPQSAASGLKSTAAYAKLPLAARVEKVLGQYLEELAEDNEYWTSNSLMRARLSKAPKPSTQQQERPTSFSHIKPLALSLRQKNQSREGTWAIEKMVGGKPTSQTVVVVPRQTFTTDSQDVPSYAHYVSISQNILAPNIKTLHCWPYFGDEFDNSQAENLKEQYHLDITTREQKLRRLRQAQKYEGYVESTLKDLDCTWADVLRFLLDPQPVFGDNTDARTAFKNREQFCKEEFDRNSKRWVAVLSSLPESNSEKIARAAVLCENFQKLARFPLWHIARRSDLCKLPEEATESVDGTPASDDFTCRICLRFDCPYLGELAERGDIDDDDDNDDDESDTSSVIVVATDLVHPPRVNHRTRVAFPEIDGGRGENDHAVIRSDKKDKRYWEGFQNKADARGPFYPCSHPGKSCNDEDADCSCAAENLPCEKFCGCTQNCERKFQGCSCSSQRLKAGKRGPCFDDDRCACWQLGRECDPDLCGGCGVCEVVDPINKHDQLLLRGRCQNAGMQRGVPKCTLLGDSGIHGLGLYACERIRAGEFVGEYRGEIITKEEAERRGAVYEHQRLSYLFSLNKDQEIDGTNFGNKMRFVNHASGNRANLYPRIIMVNTVHRIAMYASRHIEKGEELFFDYGPMFPDEQLGGKKVKKSAPHVRNANLVREFYEVEEEEDELGDVRAEGVPTGANGRRKGKGKEPKARGGARPGAGRKPRKKEVEQPVEAEAQRKESPVVEDEFADEDAGQRLTAYNIADDRASDFMDVDLEAVAAAEEDDDDAYEESDEEGSEESEVGKSSEGEGSEEDGTARRKLARSRARRSWRS